MWRATAGWRAAFHRVGGESNRIGVSLRCVIGFSGKERKSSFSEEKEAKRLFPFGLCQEVRRGASG
jgi:hypothetical protein